MLDNEFKDKINEMIQTFLKKFVEHRYDKYGNDEKVVNPMAVKAYFFNSIVEDITFNPIYTNEQMNRFVLAFQYMIEQINLYICPFAPDLKDFCKMINITNEKLIEYRDNDTPEMKIVIEKLYDYCRDGNLILGQSKIFSASITQLKAKSELEIKEKVSPKVNINITEKIPLEVMQDRLKAIANFETKTIGEKSE